MGCERYKSWLSDAAMGKLGSSREAELHAHMAECAGCRAALDEERRLLSLIDQGVQAMLAAEPSSDLVARVRVRLVEEADNRRTWFSGWIPATVGAVAAVLIVGIWLFRSEPSKPQFNKPPLVAKIPGAVVVPKEASSIGKVSPVSRSSPMDRQRLAAIRVLGARAPERRAEPEVLVPSAEKAGMQWLYGALRNDPGEVSALLESTGKPMEIEELKIPRLEIANLAVGTKLGEGNSIP